MSYDSDFNQFLAAYETPLADEPGKLIQASRPLAESAIEANADPISDLTEYVNKQLRADRLEKFAIQLGEFQQERMVVNQLDAIEAKLAALDASEGVTYRMDRINKLKQQIAQVQQQVWTNQQEFKTYYEG